MNDHGATQTERHSPPMCMEEPSGGGSVLHDPNPANTLEVGILGVAILLPDKKLVIFPDGRKPRLSVDKPGKIIDPHFAVIAFECGKFKARLRNGQEVPPTFTFNYDLSGHHKPVCYGGFFFERHKVVFKNVDSTDPEIDTKDIASMSDLVPNLQMCSDVTSGKSPYVIGLVDLTGACSIKGKSHGLHGKHAINLGNKPPRNCAELIVAKFHVKPTPPIVMMLHPKNRCHDLIIELTGKGPWRVMCANVPVDELLSANESTTEKGLHLTHIELLYDLYHLGAGQSRVVPYCPEDHPLFAQVINGHCGPPVTG